VLLGGRLADRFATRVKGARVVIPAYCIFVGNTILILSYLPVPAWSSVCLQLLGIFAIAGMPPLGIFMSEFLVVSSTFARAPFLAVALVFGLLLAFGALLLRGQGFAFGEAAGARTRSHASYVPIMAHLALVAIAGIYLPGLLVAWFQHVARMLG